tara:strand:- start:1518 stop:1727 length:210 start_codon:yes stop_codon:yes gene_type:complete
MQNRVDSQELLETMGYAREGDCRKALEAQGIAVFDGKKGIWTTWDLIKVAGMNKMGLISKETVAPEKFL